MVFDGLKSKNEVSWNALDCGAYGRKIEAIFNDEKADFEATRFMYSSVFIAHASIGALEKEKWVDNVFFNVSAFSFKEATMCIYLRVLILMYPYLSMGSPSIIGTSVLRGIVVMLMTLPKRIICHYPSLQDTNIEPMAMTLRTRVPWYQLGCSNKL
ncbi:hypothetical protein ACH5RR_003234 [Cinchona calisaya]|uniref:Uncharacterized protein n=1 Tax=Cinchona calisaya TaxID=153742 RepID=A0ABD3AU89_9GENT